MEKHHKENTPAVLVLVVISPTGRFDLNKITQEKYIQMLLMTYFTGGAIVIFIVWYLDIQLHMQYVPITTDGKS